MTQHFILCGLGRVGWRVLEYLRKAGEAVTVVDTRCDADDARLQGAALVRGDCRDAACLVRAGIAQARGVVILTSDDLVNFSAALTARHLNASVRVVVRMFNQQLIERLGAAATNMHALSTSALASPLLAMVARTGQALGVVRLPSGRDGQITELTIALQSPLVGRRLSELAEEHHLTIVAHLPVGEPARFIQDVDAAASVQAGDRIVVFGALATLATLIARGENESLPELLWGNLLKRFSRVLYRGLAQIDWPVKICTAILICVIMFSVLVFHFGMAKDTLIDAFYRTVSLLTTGADMHGEDAPPGSWQKGFISSLRLVGMLLMAAFTAIFTNYLVRANLGAALEVRRIPESGHIIVAGLGNVGFRVVEELCALGEPVVAIEHDASNPFIPTARRLGAAVIVGNAAVAEVLRQANTLTSRATVAATSNDLLNLEIALLVRELTPCQRVVVRLTEAQLAMTLRQAANIRLAMSIPELAAPAFVASLFDNQIRTLFQVEGRMLAVYELTIREPMAVSELTRRGFLTVERGDSAGNEGERLGADLLNAGDLIAGIIDLENAQSLFQYERPAAAALACNT